MLSCYLAANPHFYVSYSTYPRSLSYSEKVNDCIVNWIPFAEYLKENKKIKPIVTFA